MYNTQWVSPGMMTVNILANTEHLNKNRSTAKKKKKKKVKQKNPNDFTQYSHPYDTKEKHQCQYTNHTARRSQADSTFLNFSWSNFYRQTGPVSPASWTKLNSGGKRTDSLCLDVISAWTLKHWAASRNGEFCANFLQFRQHAFAEPS